MLSKVVGTAALIPATLAFLTRRHVPLPVTLILAHFAAAGFAVALAASDRFAGSSTAILGKQPTGAVAWWGWGLFWPYHLALQTKLWIQRQYSVEPVWNQIVDGWCVPNVLEETLLRSQALLCPTPSSSDELHQADPLCRFLGGWPASPAMTPGGSPALLDCTCELPRMQRQLPYLNLPVWDTHGPTVTQIDRGVKWAVEQRSAGRPVLIHCAHGHGRSLVVMCAVLVVSGQAGDFLEAYKMVKAARPKVRLNGRQHRALVQWQEHMKARRKAT